jgi:hypothetical protein
MTMGGTGCLLLSIPMLLTLQFARLSNRPDEVLQDALQGSLHPSNLAGLAVPNIFGSHNTYWGPGAATLQAVALTDDSFNYLFMGVVPLVLLLWLGAVGGSIWRPGRGVMAAALVVSCLFMLGRYTPLYSLAFKFLPGIGLFRRPTDASFVFEIAASILAGYCLADYVREGIPPLRISRLIAVTTAGVGIVCWAIIFSARTNHGVEAALGAGLASSILLVAVVLLVWGKQMQARVAAASLLTLIAAAELLWWNAASRLNAENHSLYAVLETPTGAEANAIAILEKAIDDDHKKGNYPRVEIVGLGGPWQNLAMVRGWEASNGYNPLRIGIYDRLVAPGEENWNAAQRRFPPSFEGYDSALARALGLTYLILGQPIDRMPNLATVPDVDLLYAESPIWIYRLRGPMPRVRLVARVEVANADALNAEGGLPLQPSMERVLVDDARAPPHSYVGSVPNVIGEVNFVARRATHLEMVTTSEIDTLLVVHDTFYPGWVAEIDGASVPILRADLLFRGVEVPAGTHHVTMRFAPFAVSNLRTAIGSASGQK